jgi:uncharacterized membrane protein
MSMGPLEELLMLLGSALCHQDPLRSFIIDGQQLPLCARDTGTGIGILMALVCWGLMRGRAGEWFLPSKATIVTLCVGFAPFLFDALTSYSGLRDTTNEVRLLTGLLAGGCVGVVLGFALDLGKGDDPVRKRAKGLLAPMGRWPVVIFPASLLMFFLVRGLIDLDGSVAYLTLALSSLLGLLTAMYLVMLLAVTSLLEGRKAGRFGDKPIIYMISLMINILLLGSLILLHRAFSA